ncbi:MAG: TolC family protein [Bacteroidota bacterium]|nr:TolC family protein [Bacteroidota bacterium]
MNGISRMRYSLFAVVLAASLAVLAPILHAQPLVLTLDDAIALSVKNNPRLEMARLDMRKADYKVLEAVGNALPNISATGQYTRAIKKPVFFVPRSMFQPGAEGYTTLAFGLDNTYQVGLTATQVLFNAIVFTGVGASKIYQKASREVYRGEFNKTVADVKRAFYGVLLMQNIHDLTLNSLRNAEDNLRTVQKMREQGLVSEYDFIRAQVQVDNIRPSVVETERNVTLALNNLKMLLGVPPTQDIHIAGGLEFVPADSLLLARAEEMVLSENANLRALKLQKQVNEEFITLYRAESYPTLTAFGNYRWESQKNDFKLTASDFISQSQVGVTLNLSLFNGLQSTARKHQAEMDYRKSEEQIALTRDGLLTQLQNIRLRLEEALRRIASQTKTVEQAEKGYEIARVRYAAGTGTQLEVNDADLALVRSRVNRIQAVYDYTLARIDLEELLSVVPPDTFE